MRELYTPGSHQCGRWLPKAVDAAANAWQTDACVCFPASTLSCLVACRTVTDVNVRPLGLIIAAISVVSSGMQQILCGTLQRQHKLQSHQLLANTAPVQGVMLLLVGPMVDKAVSGQWVSNYTVTTPAMGCLLLSCLISVGVNISQFMCLGRFSAVTFQVRIVQGAFSTKQRRQWYTAVVKGHSTGGGSRMLFAETG